MAREFRHVRNQRSSHANNRTANLSKFFSILVKSNDLFCDGELVRPLNRFQSN